MGNGEDQSEESLKSQPVEDVKTDTEELEATSQADNTEKKEFYFDADEGDQEKPKTTMTQGQSHAAWLKEKNKRKQKQEALDKEKEKNERIEKELQELKATVGSITKGKPPTLESCDFDEKEFQAKTRDYYSNSKADQSKSKGEGEEKPKPIQSDEDADFFLYQKEQDLTEKIPEYVEARSSIVKQLESHQVESPDAAINYLSSLAMQKNADIAKAIFAMSKDESILPAILKAANKPILVADLIEKAAGKVKTRTKKQIDSEPEPNVNNSGSVDVNEAKVAKLRAIWAKDSTASNYRAYQQAKTKR